MWSPEVEGDRAGLGEYLLVATMVLKLQFARDAGDLQRIQSI